MRNLIHAIINQIIDYTIIGLAVAIFSLIAGSVGSVALDFVHFRPLVSPITLGIICFVIGMGFVVIIRVDAALQRHTPLQKQNSHSAATHRQV